MAKTLDLKEVLLSKIGEIEPLEGAKTSITKAERQIPGNLFYEANSGEFHAETVVSDYGSIRPLSIEEAKDFEAKINQCIEELFVENVHYGTVAGIKKKFLFKAGGEVIINLLGVCQRTEIIEKTEDYANGFFSYTCKTWLIDGSGVVRSEGLGCCNSRENKYQKSNPYNIQNILIKLSKKRSMIDAVLGIGALSNRFSQDEDLVESITGGKNPEELKQSQKSSRTATKKQIAFLEKLMKEANSSPEALNRFVKKNYNVDDYHNANAVVVSELIEKFQAAKQ